MGAANSPPLLSRCPLAPAARLDALSPPTVPRAEVIDELYQAVVNRKAPRHNGAWATATVEVLLAMLRSAREGSDVRLSHQVALS